MSKIKTISLIGLIFFVCYPTLAMDGEGIRMAPEEPPLTPGTKRREPPLASPPKPSSAPQAMSILQKQRTSVRRSQSIDSGLGPFPTPTSNLKKFFNKKIDKANAQKKKLDFFNILLEARKILKEPELTQAIQQFDFEVLDKTRKFEKKVVGEKFLTPQEWTQLTRTLRVRGSAVNKYTNDDLKKMFGEESQFYREDREDVYKKRLKVLFGIKNEGTLFFLGPGY